MTPQQIKANAPEGATHYNQNGYYFRNIDGKSCEMWSAHNQDWFKTHVSVFDELKPSSRAFLCYNHPTHSHMPYPLVSFGRH